MVKRLFFWTTFGLVLLVVSVIVSLSVGSAHIPLHETWRVILQQVPWIGQMIETDWTESTEQILLQVRAPRVLLALLVGAALALAGTGFQGVLRNPLAEPYTLGVASGSAVGALVVILLGLQYAWSGSWTIPLAAFLTGLLTLWLVIILSRQQSKLKIETLILAGVVIQAFFGSVVSFLVSISRNSMNEMIFWLMGSLSLKGWSYSFIILPYLVFGFIILLLMGRELNLFSLGERQAMHLGVNIERTKLVVLIICTLLTAAAVSVAGIISFVGLVIPHILRLMVGSDYRILIPLSVIFGAIYVLWADTLSRMLLDPQVIPLGVITSILGAPFFAWLLIQNKRGAAS